MNKIRLQYPILEKHTYLNTANHGLISQELMDYRANELGKMRDKASIYANQRNVFIDEVRVTIATFLDAQVENTAVIPNFSTGFNTLIEGIDKNSKFLMLEGDYPSVNWPVEVRGFDCVYADIDEHLEENILKACEQHQPDFFCFSVVQYISGIKIDLEFVKTLKEQFPSMILIGDLTQYVGCEYISTGNVMDAIPEFIGRFEPGHQDMIAFGSLKFAMEEVQKIGLNNIQENLNDWSQTVKAEFTKRDLLSENVVGRKNHSTIFNIKGSTTLFEKLSQNNIITSLRGDGIRISFSYFNNQKDLNHLLETLDL